MTLFYAGLLLISYLFGTFNGAYYIGKKKAGKDIRKLGSSNAGARNAGRIFGRSAFLYTILLDALKVVIPLGIASFLLHIPVFMLGSMAFAALIGHIWPVFLQFHGGKGVVVFLASAFVLAPLSLAAAGLVLLVGLSIKRGFSIAGLTALAAVPVTLLLFSRYILAGVFSIMLVIVLLAHKRRN